MKHLDKRLLRYGAIAAGIAATLPAQAQEEVEVNSLLLNNYFDLNGDGQDDFRGTGYSSSWKYTRSNTSSNVYMSSGSFYGTFAAVNQTDYTVKFQNGQNGNTSDYFFLQPGDTVGPKSSFSSNYFYLGSGDYSDTLSVEPKDNGGGLIVVKEHAGARVAENSEITWDYRYGAFTTDNFEKELYVGVRMEKKEAAKEEEVGVIKEGLAENVRTAIAVEPAADSVYYGWIKFILDYEPDPNPNVDNGEGEGEGGSEEVKGNFEAHRVATVEPATPKIPTFKVISHYMNDVVNEQVVIPDAKTGTGVAELTSSIGMEVFPNPTSGLLSVNTSVDVEFIAIVNLSGETVLSSTSTQLDVSALDAGVYFVLATTEDGIAASQFIKE